MVQYVHFHERGCSDIATQTNINKYVIICTRASCLNVQSHTFRENQVCARTLAVSLCVCPVGLTTGLRHHTVRAHALRKNKSREAVALRLL